jgi:hypothetical protein
VPDEAVLTTACEYDPAIRIANHHHLSCLADLSDQVARTLCYPPSQDLVAVFGNPDHVVFQIEGRVRAMPVFRHPSILVDRRWKLTA